MIPTIIASQSGAGYFPENTVFATTQSLLQAPQPADGIEMDWHLTLDRQFVAHHDYALHPDLTRDAQGQWLNATGPIIKDTLLTTLKQYGLGGVNPTSKLAKRYPQRSSVSHEPIATFEAIAEVLLRQDNQAVECWFEAKTNPYNSTLSCATEDYADALSTLLEHHPLLSRTVLIAFDWKLLDLVKQRLPTIQTGFLTIDFNWMSKGSQPVDASKHVRWLGDHHPDDFGGDIAAAVTAAGGSYWSPFFRDIDPAMVKAAQGQGIKVSTWGADSEEELMQVRDMQVDSLTTGYVARARHIFPNQKSST